MHTWCAQELQRRPPSRFQRAEQAAARGAAQLTNMAAVPGIVGSGEEPPADILEIEHVIGYTGLHPHTLNVHPGEANTFVTSLGAHVAIGDTTDPHKQEFLRAHDESISSVVLSPMGTLIASGQVGSRRAAVRAGRRPQCPAEFRGVSPLP